MVFKEILIIGICFILYGTYILKQKGNWIKTKSIVTKVENKNPIIRQNNGLSISECESVAEVKYKRENEYYTTMISAIKSQPLQIGNIIDIEYNENDINRIQQKIPSGQSFIAFGICLCSISMYFLYYKNFNNQ